MKTPKPRYTLTLRPLPDKSDPAGVRRLRAALKALLRSYRLRCERCEPEPQEGGSSSCQ